MPSNLPDFAIKNLKSKGEYRVSQSLYVQVKTHPRLVKEWRIRQKICGKRKWTYIGSYPAISRKQTRAKAAVDTLCKYYDAISEPIKMRVANPL